ncbi:SDR family oxidoreductase [Legionella sp. 27cVA30]|uniref:SDR family oxidoreductase n=1 Tax=Legionella sp. 27cVA30 TaxID=2905657 RepID=UPI0020A1FE2E|nr:SDR family oxidoreductase [Legionella sp. 27cVA30]MCP0913674.1 SDR family oxidoreductase [Legionella sp. 27cVA30]
MDSKLTKPLILITGASSGIGASAARLFAQVGFPLGLLARNIHALHALNLKESICIETDVTDFNAFQRAVQQAEEKYGPVDCLINNAGFGKTGDFDTLTQQEHERMVHVNLLGVIHGMETVLPGMKSRRSGTIINISSLADRHSRPQLATYAASKAAVKSLSESLRAAYAKFGIRICNFSPAKVKTPLLMQSNLHDEQVIPVDEIAKMLLWIYEQPKSICIRDIVIAPTYYEA